jgi:hypothetical protein
MGDGAVTAHGPVVIIDAGIAAGDQILAISWLEPEHEWESGYAAWSVPPQQADDVDSVLVCVHCFLEEHPEAGLGMELAREHGEAIRDGNEWAAR